MVILNEIGLFFYLFSSEVVDTCEEHNVHRDKILPETSLPRDVHVPGLLIDLLSQTYY